MSNHHLILSILLVSACLLYAQPDAPYEPDPITVGLWHMDNAEPESLWTITIGDENEVTNLGSVIETGDGAYFICGSSTVDTIQSMLLMEMDEDGETIWSRGYSGLSSFVDLVVVGDTSLAILCVGDEINDFYILITDLNGDSLTYYADSLEEEGWFSDIEITDDVGFLLVGTCYDGNFNFEMWVVKLDSSGEVEWSTTYDCGEAEVSSCDGILRTSGGNYLIYGRSDLSGYMLEIDPDGEINWARRYGDGISCRICSVIQNEDLYYCTGDRFDRLANSWHYLLFSVDENGNLQAGSMFGTNNSNEIGKSIMMSSDDKIIIAGIDRYLIDDREYFRYGGNMGLVKTGTERGFEFIWYKAYGDDSHEEAHQVFQCPDNSYLLFGTTTDDEQNSRIRIIKTTPDLDIGADVSGNMNRGELNGDAVQTDNGRWGEALDLTNESSGCMLVENDSSLQTDILTVECWFRMTDDIPQIGALVNKVLAEDFASYALFASNASDEVVFLIGTEAHEFVVEYETEPDDNRWHHIAGTFDNRRMKLYYDGRLVDELDVREAIHYDECPLLIGSNEEFDYGEYQFYGLIDEVRISNYPRVFYHGVEQYTDAQFPQEFAILNVYPNPFNSAARIDFSLPYNGYATLKMMDCNGRVVSNLFEKKLLAGKHRYDLRCIDNPAGLYFIQLQSGADVSVRKVVFLK